MNKKIDEIDARQANRRRMNYRVLVVSLLAAVVVLAIILSIAPA